MVPMKNAAGKSIQRMRRTGAFDLKAGGRRNRNIEDL
jgi:hypothetical protein